MIRTVSKAINIITNVTIDKGLLLPGRICLNKGGVYAFMSLQILILLLIVMKVGTICILSCLIESLL